VKSHRQINAQLSSSDLWNLLSKLSNQIEHVAFAELRDIMWGDLEDPLYENIWSELRSELVKGNLG